MNESKLDKIIEDVTEIKVILARNTTSLEQHMKRTEMLENRVSPLEEHKAMVLGAGALLTALGVIAGIYAALR